MHCVLWFPICFLRPNLLERSTGVKWRRQLSKQKLTIASSDLSSSLEAKMSDGAENEAWHDCRQDADVEDVQFNLECDESSAGNGAQDARTNTGASRQDSSNPVQHDRYVRLKYEPPHPRDSLCRTGRFQQQAL